MNIYQTNCRKLYFSRFVRVLKAGIMSGSHPPPPPSLNPTQHTRNHIADTREGAINFTRVDCVRARNVPIAYLFVAAPVPACHMHLFGSRMNVQMLILHINTFDDDATGDSMHSCIYHTHVTFDRVAQHQSARAECSQNLFPIRGRVRAVCLR